MNVSVLITLFVLNSLNFFGDVISPHTPENIFKEKIDSKFDLPTGY